MELVISTLEQGMIYGIMALGVYITYKILDFPDLTVDGSFPMGAAITAVMITNGVPAILTLPVCFLVGALAGVLTGLIHVKLKVRDLLSGIIMMTALYTVNLRIAGRANLPFYKEVTVFDNSLVDNASIVTAMGRDRGKVKILGLAIANGLVTLSGCLFAQQQRCFEISVGTGTVVVGLASVIIGTSLYQKLEGIGSISKALHNVRVGMVTFSVVIGSILYKACVAIALRMGLKSTDLKLITAVLFLVILVVSMERKGRKNA